MCNWPVVVSGIHLNLCYPDPPIRAWDDLGNAADRPKRSRELWVNYHGDKARFQFGCVFLPLSVCLQGWKIVPDKCPPELVSKDLCVSPAAAAQLLGLRVHHLGHPIKSMFWL